jgi:hypothetical protein
MRRVQVDPEQHVESMKVVGPAVENAEAVTLAMCVAAMGDSEVLQALLDAGPPPQCLTQSKP